VLMGVALAMGGVPTDAHWIVRLQHLHGDFRRTPSDWWSVVFAAGVCVTFGGLFVGLIIGAARDPEPLFAPAWFALPAVALFGLAVGFLRHERLPTQRASQLEELLPHRWGPRTSTRNI